MAEITSIIFPQHWSTQGGEPIVPSLIHWFVSLQDAKKTIETWRELYNRERPHSSLKYQTPNEYADMLMRAIPLGGIREGTASPPHSGKHSQYNCPSVGADHSPFQFLPFLWSIPRVYRKQATVLSRSESYRKLSENAGYGSDKASVIRIGP